MSGAQAERAPRESRSPEELTPEERAEEQARHAQEMARLAADQEPHGKNVLPQLPHPSSTLSGETVVREFEGTLQLILARLQQVADLNTEQWRQMGTVMEQMQATMRLAEVLIGGMDEVVQGMRQQINLLGVATSALTRTNQEWQATMAELTEQNNQANS